MLVGHSYGGAVITNAATGNPNVKSLVYIAAYALERRRKRRSKPTPSAAEPPRSPTISWSALSRARPAGDGDAYIDPAWFPRLFAQDLPRSTAAVMAATQRPGALAALLTPSGAPAWKTIPSWYLVANQDRIIPPEAERAMAARAKAKTVSINSSHVAMMSHPGCRSEPHQIRCPLTKSARPPGSAPRRRQNTDAPLIPHRAQPAPSRRGAGCCRVDHRRVPISAGVRQAPSPVWSAGLWS